MYDKDMETVTLSSKGQIAIPKAVRERLGLREGMLLEIDLHGREITLRPLEDWRGLRGIAAGADLLKARAEERQQELEQERQPGSRRG